MRCVHVKQVPKTLAPRRVTIEKRCIEKVERLVTASGAVNARLPALSRGEDNGCIQPPFQETALPRRKTLPPTEDVSDVPDPQAPSSVSALISQALLPLIARVPASDETRSATPGDDARQKANAAAAKAAITAGTLSLPPGAVGWLTILPEMVGVWKIQKQLVADIAAIYGKEATLTPEQVMYCLFQHTAAQGVRDLVVRVGQRTLVRRASPILIGTLTRRIGASLAKRAAGKGVARWLPIVGAVGMGAYAYFDTAQVAATAIDLFDGVIEIDAIEVDKS